MTNTNEITITERIEETFRANIKLANLMYCVKEENPITDDVIDDFATNISDNAEFWEASKVSSEFIMNSQIDSFRNTCRELIAGTTERDSDKADLLRKAAYSAILSELGIIDVHQDQLY